MASPQLYRLGVQKLFNKLTPREQLYSHYMARASWHGTRIILRQVSPESMPIFDFILQLHRSCAGDWGSLAQSCDVSAEDLQAFLEYAATFLANIGNYYGSGDQKFVPKMSPKGLERLAARSSTLMHLHSQFKDDIFVRPPYALGYSSTGSQSAYYPGDSVAAGEVEAVKEVLDAHGVSPENTRIRKSPGDGTEPASFEVLQASVATGSTPLASAKPGALIPKVILVKGDYSSELKAICMNLDEASKYAANDLQRKFLAEYVQSFTSGCLEAYRESQKTWVRDHAPKVENIIGFVEPYRDPAGMRAEFEGLVAIADPDETQLLAHLVKESPRFIRRLPWASAENNGNGALEKSLFEPPDFSSIHALAYCSSIIFPGINLPNYNDIRQDVGFKNVIIANRMAAESRATQWPFIDAAEMDTFRRHKHAAYYTWVVLHELLGHGTGKLLVEEEEEEGRRFNFDPKHPPADPLTGGTRPVRSWYRPGQTWTGVFGDLATTVDECRAELVGAYLMDDPELLALFGYTRDSTITAEDVTYNLYQQLGVDGLRGLANFNADTMTWGQAHSRAHYAILQCLLRHPAGSCLTIDHDEPSPTRPRRLRVRVDRTRVGTWGKNALRDMLLRLHVYRCTADVRACRSYYEDLTRVELGGEAMAWRETVMASRPGSMLGVQGNTFLVDDEDEVAVRRGGEGGKKVVLREYDTTLEGIIQSWVERDV